jgi:hypothetical protein
MLAWSWLGSASGVNKLINFLELKASFDKKGRSTPSRLCISTSAAPIFHERKQFISRLTYANWEPLDLKKSGDIERKQSDMHA